MSDEKHNDELFGDKLIAVIEQQTGGMARDHIATIRDTAMREGTITLAYSVKIDVWGNGTRLDVEAGLTFSAMKVKDKTQNTVSLEQPLPFDGPEPKDYVKVGGERA